MFMDNAPTGFASGKSGRAATGPFGGLPIDCGAPVEPIRATGGFRASCNPDEVFEPVSFVRETPLGALKGIAHCDISLVHAVSEPEAGLRINQGALAAESRVR